MISPFIMSNLLSPEAGGESLGAGRPPGSGTGSGTGSGSLFSQIIQKASATVTAPAALGGQASSVPLKGRAVVAKLKQSLQASGAPFDKLVAGDKALAAMQKVLVCAGFDPAQVESLLERLKADSRGQGVKVSALFDGISQLKEPVTQESRPAYLASSTIPFLETALSQLGLSRQAVTSVLDKARVAGKGVDAQKLADALKLKLGAGKKAPADASSLARMNALLQRIGLGTDAGGKPVVDLHGLVSALEKYAGQKASDEQRDGKKRDDNTAAAALPWVLALLPGHRNVDASGTQTGSNASQRAESAAMKTFQQLVLQHNGAPKDTPLPSGTGKLSLEHFAKALETQTKQQGGGGQTVGKAIGRNSHTIGTSTSTGGDASVSPTQVATSKPAIAASPVMPNADASASKKTGTAATFTDQMPSDLGNADASKRDGQPALATAQPDGGRKQEMVKTVAPSGKTDAAANALVAGGSTRPGVSAQPATQAASQQAPAARTLPYYVLDQVSRQIIKSRLSNESEIQLQLKPPSLGRVKLSIKQTTNGIKVNILTDNHAARQLIASHAGHLKNVLTDQGIRLNRVDVGAQGSAFGQTMADARQHQGSEQFYGRKGFANRPRIKLAPPPQGAAIESVMAHQSSALNLVA